jgi:chemotaxis protein methyltransferase CheR
VNGFLDALVPGGYLFLGHSESVGRLTAAFSLERMDRFLAYRKPS